MLEYLDGIEAGETMSLAEGVKNFCVRNSGKGIVVLISDLMDKNGYESALRYLVSQRMDVYVIHVLSQEELDPDVKGDLKLVDCEDQDIAEITVSAPLLARYKIDAQRVRGRRAGVLQPPRNELSACQQSDAGEGFDWKLFAATRSGAIVGQLHARHERDGFTTTSFRD